jgi:trimeric autotransporter adhesin
MKILMLHVVALTTVPSISNTADLTAAVARIQVIQYDALEAVASSSKTLAVTAEITGAGRIGSTADAVGATSVIAHPAGTSTTTQAATRDFFVFADGRSGEATITIKVGGVTTLTRKVAFFGAATQLKLKAATAAAPNPSKSYLAVGGTMTIAVVPYDANNVKLTEVAVTATSETTTIATVVAAATAGSVTVTGVAVGKTNITIKNSTLGTLVVPVEVTKSTGVAKLTLDKTSAQPGEKVTWTITATDVNGRPVADGTSIALFSSITANMSVTGLPTGSETLTGGISTGSFFAPTSGSGTLTITATQGTAHDTYIAGLKAATAAGTSATFTAVKDVVEMAVVNAAVDAAAAAAEEATAAANDATDAALSAAEAAEAATAMAQEAVDAVAELSASVTKLISALRAQITTLTNLVVKIQKKVKA